MPRTLIAPPWGHWRFPSCILARSVAEKTGHISWRSIILAIQLDSYAEAGQLQ